MMNQVFGSLLPSCLRSSSKLRALEFCRYFKAVADVEIDFNNRETLKKYVGIRDHLSKEPGTKGKFIEALRELLTAVRTLPEASDYRNAVEATIQYRLKVCEANEADAAIEEVLDAHMEELIKECKEEQRLIPLMREKQPWDVAADHAVPVYDYHDASEILQQKKKV